MSDRLRPRHTWQRQMLLNEMSRRQLADNVICYTSTLVKDPGSFNVSDNKNMKNKQLLNHSIYWILSASSCHKQLALQIVYFHILETLVKSFRSQLHKMTFCVIAVFYSRQKTGSD